jgi:acetyl/propionyl-CoA carboxylase alpha subunit
VSIHYDPMLAKVIAHAETRAAAIARLASALRSYPVLGVRTNIPFLLSVLDHPEFQAGHVDIGFLDRNGAALAEDAPVLPDFIRDEVGSLTGSAQQDPSTPAVLDPWRTLRGWRT